MTPQETEDARRAAERLLASNWRGTHTVPAAGLYPHQWSWDSAFITFGTRHSRPADARLELATLFDAQWADGRIPQIVYSPGGDYSPGPEFWQSSRLDGAPGVATAALIQPPMHAWAALAVHEADPEGSRESGFLEKAYPALLRWHEYLSSRRTVAGHGAGVIVHPWESGVDNSPLWDAAMARIEVVSTASLPRPDLAHAGEGERPTDRDYARYFAIAAAYRDSHASDDLASLPFALEDPGFTAIWARSERALASIADHIGEDSARHVRRQAELATAVEGLWNSRIGCYSARDIRSGELVDKRTASGLLPLLVPGLLHGPELLQLLWGPSFEFRTTALPPSNDLLDATFDRASYWRGPAWFNTAWLLAQALRDLDRHEEVAMIAERMMRLAVAGDFPEYVDPFDGSPRGTRAFSWTAALTLDLLTPTTIDHNDTTEAIR
ncbi:MAG: hypothetical protein QOI02_174 [Actinomycetota bacterium]|nr:hypothetical protein [Actinomycetota bacterium]